MKTTEMPPCACVACGKVLDMASTASGRSPKPGDVSVCLTCGHISVFAEDLSLRAPTDAEMHAIAGDPRILRMQRARPK